MGLTGRLLIEPRMCVQADQAVIDNAKEGLDMRLA